MALYSLFARCLCRASAEYRTIECRCGCGWIAATPRCALSFLQISVLRGSPCVWWCVWAACTCSAADGHSRCHTMDEDAASKAGSLKRKPQSITPTAVPILTPLVIDSSGALKGAVRQRAGSLGSLQTPTPTAGAVKRVGALPSAVPGTPTMVSPMAVGAPVPGGLQGPTTKVRLQRMQGATHFWVRRVISLRVAALLRWQAWWPAVVTIGVFLSLLLGGESAGRALRRAWRGNCDLTNRLRFFAAGGAPAKEINEWWRWWWQRYWGERRRRWKVAGGGGRASASGCGGSR
jgi:hypothetical protein